MSNEVSRAEANRSAKEALAKQISLEEVDIQDLHVYGKPIGSNTHYIYSYKFIGGAMALGESDYIAVSRITGQVDYIGKSSA